MSLLEDELSVTTKDIHDFEMYVIHLLALSSYTFDLRLDLCTILNRLC